MKTHIAKVVGALAGVVLLGAALSAPVLAGEPPTTPPTPMAITVAR